MPENSRKGFVLSILLHLTVAVTVVVLTFFKPQETPKPAVFTLVAPPPSTAVVAEPAPQFELPEYTPPPQPQPQPRLQPTPPPPVVEQSRPQPAPRPVPQKTAPPVAEKKPEPKPKPADPPPQPISIDQFREKYGEPKQRTPRPTPPRPVNVPRIDTQFSTNIREAVINLDSVVNLTDAELAALDRYIALLREALRRNWEKPPGVAQTTAAVADFDVQPNGRLTGVKISKPSGNALFDESVRAAFVKLGSAGPTPDGKLQRLTLTFRMRDQ